MQTVGRVGIALAVALLALVVLLATLLATREGREQPAGEIQGARVPPEVVSQREAAQRNAARSLADANASIDRQILFGDLHVHTTYSIDAFLYALPIFGSEGVHPPADACDFARHCAALDFFSINDHAEGLTPERWQETVASIRTCNARAGRTNDPDMVAFLGWEWTQVGATPATHYGHKNVVVRGIADGDVPARPIAYLRREDLARAPNPLLLRAGESIATFLGEPYGDFLWWIRRMAAMENCPRDVDTHELPLDCRETAETPSELFAKLDQWGGDALVIPHGLAWGIHAPPGATLDNQLTRSQHDPSRQRLLEVFSGHGNSEEFRSTQHRAQAGSDEEVCPEPTPDFLPCCWQAGELMRERCGDLPADECERRVVAARRYTLEGGVAPLHVFPDVPVDEWLDCDQCRDCFKPALTPRAGESAQYALAVSGFEPGTPEDPFRFRFGFIASSDNHRARSATGYKQFARTLSTDARGMQDPEVEALLNRLYGRGGGDPRQPQRVEFNPRSFEALLNKERTASFMYPGGLVAVHVAGRDRDAIFDALVARQVYGTSGPRILLWFDLLNGPEGTAPMGSEVELAAAPRFRVRAAGSFVQKPGCPDFTGEALAPARVRDLCLGECYHPSETRHPIAAIEVVRVLPQMVRGQPIAPRIEDPWRRFECEPDPDGCTVEFEDPDFLAEWGDAVYYVRALQAPTPAINGAQLRTEFDAAGRAVATNACYGDWRTPEDDLCLAPVNERAWSSPIYVDRRRH